MSVTARRKPLGLPVGSVRALLLLGLCARAILDLRADHDVAPWLGTALVLTAAGYFAARAAGRPPPATAADAVGAPLVASVAPPKRELPPLGLPSGTVRTLFLLAVGYGAFLWFRRRPPSTENSGLVIVLGAFVLGVVVRWMLARLRRPEDAATAWFDHVQALVALIAVGGLVTLGVRAAPETLPEWGEATLAAAAVYYVGVR
jgi:hypothetical protein